LGVLGATANGQVIWANNGQNKVAQEELRASADPNAVLNSVWDGTTIGLFGGRNEVVAFNLVIEAPTADLTGVTVSFDTLMGPGGGVIHSVQTSGEGVFEWVDRPIELFYVRYLQIKGVGRLVYNHYDERHVPERFRRPWSGEGEVVPGTGWVDRPDHDMHYPDIAVPMELVGAFDVMAGTSQSVWVDVYIPSDAPGGMYTGDVTVAVAGQADVVVPVSLEVMPFTLPDEPSQATMLVLGYEDINLRYVGEQWPYDPPLVEASRAIRDKHFQLAHRHRISLIDGDGVPERDGDPPHPSTEWQARFDGSLFTPAHGYDGPGAGVGNKAYSVALYGFWWWEYPDMTEAEMWTKTDAWVSWFDANAPDTNYFLYIVDELSDPESLAKIELWSGWIDANPGPGERLQTLASLDYILGVTETPSLDIPSAGGYTAPAAEVEAAAQQILDDPDKRLWWYNGWRPYCGSFATEDDGVALRLNAWAHHKKQIERWFVWESTYYDNFQGGMGQTNVFQSAFTFGVDSGFDPVFGRTGWNYSNGDGVLFYPGTDIVYPEESYGVAGPLASLRLKLWRRGIQDGDYLTMASAYDPVATDALVEAMVPTVLWEYGVDNPDDPTYVHTDISWSTDPDDWEAARRQLAGLILCDRADMNNDRMVNSQDFVVFLNAFVASDPAADFSGDGSVNSQDFVAFLNVFVGGC
jgi:hypothetical protein